MTEYPEPKATDDSAEQRRGYLEPEPPQPKPQQRWAVVAHQPWDRSAFSREVAGRILRYRTEHNLTQTALARKVGVTQSVIARLESGDQLPSIQTLAKLSAGMALEFHLRFSGGRVELVPPA